MRPEPPDEPSVRPKFTGSRRPVSTVTVRLSPAGSDRHALGQRVGVEADDVLARPGQVDRRTRPASSVSTESTSSPEAVSTVMVTPSMGPERLVVQRAADLLALGVGDPGHEGGQRGREGGDQQREDQRPAPPGWPGEAGPPGPAAGRCGGHRADRHG